MVDSTAGAGRGSNEPQVNLTLKREDFLNNIRQLQSPAPTETQIITGSDQDLSKIHAAIEKGEIITVDLRNNKSDLWSVEWTIKNKLQDNAKVGNGETDASMQLILQDGERIEQEFSARKVQNEEFKEPFAEHRYRYSHEYPDPTFSSSLKLVKEDQIQTEVSMRKYNKNGNLEKIISFVDTVGTIRVSERESYGFSERKIREEFDGNHDGFFEREKISTTYSTSFNSFRAMHTYHTDERETHYDIFMRLPVYSKHSEFLMDNDRAIYNKTVQEFDLSRDGKPDEVREFQRIGENVKKWRAEFDTNRDGVLDKAYQYSEYVQENKNDINYYSSSNELNPDGTYRVLIDSDEGTLSPDGDGNVLLNIVRKIR